MDNSCGSIHPDDYVNSSPAVYGNTVYIGGSDGYLYALNPETGALRWKFNGGGAFPSEDMSSPVVRDGVVYTSCYDGNVYALDAASGSLIWNHTTTKLQSIYASPTLSNGVIYLSAGSGVYALDATNGAERWHFTTGDQFPMQASPTVAGGVVYVGGNNGNLYAIDANSGSKLWHYNTGSPIVSSVAIDHGVLYLGLRAGAIIALGTPDFVTPQPTPTPTPTPTAIPTPTPTTNPTTTPTNKPTPRPTATITPQPTQTPNSSNIIKATTDQGTQIELSIKGNITSTQISNTTITTNQTTSKTTIAFTLTGQPGTTGFANLTIPKNTITYDGAPTVYFDSAIVQNQGFSMDDNNFYVWYETHFSIHQMEIVFSPFSSTSTSSPESQNSLPSLGLVEIAVLTLMCVLAATVIYVAVRNKRKPKSRLESIKVERTKKV